MLNYMKFGSYDNKRLGIYVTNMPNVPSPVERGESVRIPGRNGEIWMGEGAYETFGIAPEIWVPPRVSIHTARAWLTGSGNLELEEGSETYFKARVSQGVEFAPLPFEDGYKAAVHFECNPFRYVKSNIGRMFTEAGIINNPYNAYSEPLITVAGSGDGEVTIGQVTFALEGIVLAMDIDTELQECYFNNTLCNDRMTGAFPTLEIGDNAVSWTGGIESVLITPRWRMI